MALTQDGVLLFLMVRGGKVKNTELVSAFTAHISCSELEERKRNRDLFKSFVNNVAVVKQVHDVKYVVVKKKYQEMISISSSPPSSTTLSRCGSCSITSADVLNNNSWFCTNPHRCYINTSQDFISKQQLQTGSTAITPVAPSGQDEALTSLVLNVANNTRKSKLGAVFAVVAIKPLPCSHSEKIKLNHSVEIPPEQELIKTIETGKTLPYLNHKADLNKSPRIKRRQTVRSSSPAPKRGSKVVNASLGAKDSCSIRLEPREHEWLVKSATGCWNQLYNLLVQDVHLTEKRNFISGFTALHWAAKHGNSKMVRRILDVGKKVDVNIKSHDGYTALHVAAIHSHESVLRLLVRKYGANCNIRDNSGRKAYQYLCKDLSAEVKELLGDPAVSCQVTEHACSDEQHVSDLFKNLNTFGKLFQASVRRRKKSRPRSSFEQEETKNDCTFDHKHK